MNHPTPLESATAPTDMTGRPGVASGTRVTTDAAKSWKFAPAEKLSSRYRVVTLDFSSGRMVEKRIKPCIEHHGQTVLCLGYRPDRLRGTVRENDCLGIFLSAYQEVWAAEGREASPQWIRAKDLIAGRHVLRLAYAGNVNPWAEVILVTEAKQAEYEKAPVHELVLEESDSYEVQDVLLRATSIPAKIVKKRITFPLKDYPIINYVPQPKSLMVAHAEVWYRKTVSLLPRCVDGSLDPVIRLHAILALKERIRDVAAKAAIDPKSRKDFIEKHPVPTIAQLIPEHDQLTPLGLAQAIDAAIADLSAPGPRYYSAYAGGMESDHVRDFPTSWEFNGEEWIPSERKGN